jgi:hypothetical protein
MIADRADHARLQVVESDVIGKAADVQLCVVMTARIAATDKHSVSPWLRMLASDKGLSWSRRFGIVHGIAYQSPIGAEGQIILWFGLGT